MTFRARPNIGLFALLFLFAIPTLTAQDHETADLTGLSLEGLLNTHVTSVSRHDEQLRSTASAVFLITQEDIRRSGATDVADLLRMVPGMDVAQLTSNTWAVSARGFNAQYATKLLVLIDGRAVYGPTFSGVFWHLQNLVLEDIEKIEVIRGPGATMWGANAVNGVISITTKRASDTQGGLFVAGAGTDRPGEGSFRYGAPIGSSASFRVFSRQTTRSSFTKKSGADGNDEWNLTDVGFRLDWKASKSDDVTLESDIYRGVRGTPWRKLISLSPLTYGASDNERDTGGYALTRWKHSFSDASNLILQFNYDTKRVDTYWAGHVRIFDFDLQHDFKAGTRNNIIWGIGHREYWDAFDNSLGFRLNPARMNTRLTNAFVQDEIAVVPEQLRLIVGSKFERSSFTGYDTQPSIKLSWTPSIRHSAWVSASRAVRTANRIERGVNSNVDAFPAGATFGLLNIYGRPDTRSEGLIAYESGYRYQANRRLWLDFSTFYNVYDHLSTAEQGARFLDTKTPPPHIVLPMVFGNEMKGETYGAEIAANYTFNSRLTIRGNYSLIRMALHSYSGLALATEGLENQNPQHQIYAGSFWTLPKSFEVSMHTYFTSPLKSFNLPAHTRLDLTASWKRLENIELSVTGQNLINPRSEFDTVLIPGNIVGRNIHAKVAWRF